MTEIKEQFSGNGPFKAPATGKGSFLVRVIAPGLSKNRRRYRTALLERRAELVKPGTPMYLDHQKGARSVKDLAAVVVEGGKYDPAGPWGAGIYCRARPITTKKDLLREMETAIGVSIMADGVVVPCTAPGHAGEDLVEDITAFTSIDFVAAPAAGGKYACPVRTPKALDPKAALPLASIAAEAFNAGARAPPREEQPAAAGTITSESARPRAREEQLEEARERGRAAARRTIAEIEAGGPAALAIAERRAERVRAHNQEMGVRFHEAFMAKWNRVREHLVDVAELRTGNREAAEAHVCEMYGPPPTSANRYYAALQESTAARLALRTDPATATRQAAEHVAATRQRQRARMNQAFAAIAPTLEDAP